MVWYSHLFKNFPQFVLRQEIEQKPFLREGRKKELVFHGSRDSSGKNEKVLEIDDGNGCTTM